MPVPRRQTVPFFFSSRRRHTRWTGDWSSDVCSSDLGTTSFTFTVSLSQAGVTSQSVNWAVTGSGANAADFAGGGLPSGTEIGRASCRERAAIPVGGGVLTRKETERRGAGGRGTVPRT